MRLLWPITMNLMLGLTGMTILIGIILNHDIDSILMRGTLVLMGSGLVLMFIAMLISRGHQKQQLLAVKNALNQQQPKQAKAQQKPTMAA